MRWASCGGACLRLGRSYHDVERDAAGRAKGFRRLLAVMYRLNGRRRDAVGLVRGGLGRACSQLGGYLSCSLVQAIRTDGLIVLNRSLARDAVGSWAYLSLA